MLDIGGDVGAAIVTVPACWDGWEMEIRDDPGEWAGRHVAVRPRPLRDGTVFAAVFPALQQGTYRTRIRFGPTEPEVALNVEGGTVARAEWPVT